LQVCKLAGRSLLSDCAPMGGFVLKVVLCELCPDRAKVFTLRHHKQARTIAPFLPQFADGTFFFRVVVAPPICPFVFDDEIPPVAQSAHKVRIELVGGGLQPERLRATRRVAHPELYLWQRGDVLGALLLLATVERPYLGIIMLLEVVIAFVGPIVGIALGIVGEATFWRDRQEPFCTRPSIRLSAVAAKLAEAAYA